jgi:hypothetical protein
MAELAFVSARATEAVAIEKYTLSASDTFTIPESGDPYIVLENGTADSVDAVFTGQGLPVTQTFGGYGTATFANLTLTVAAGTSQVVYLTSFKNLLSGEVTLVGEGLGALLFTA